MVKTADDPLTQDVFWGEVVERDEVEREAEERACADDRGKRRR